MAENNLISHIVTVFGEIESETLHLKNDSFPQFTLKIEAAGCLKTSVHIIAHKTVIQTIR
jgi:hypothetical protein